jgi:dTDP-4-amino-4,6-dideoxygalactose transaminase
MGFGCSLKNDLEYLTTLLREIPGILPARPHDGCTRNAYHLYLFRYQQERFADLPRNQFLKALSAEGIPASAGYTPLNKEPFIQQTLQSRGYRASYSAERLARWEEQNHCPANDQLCEEGAWLYQSVLLAKRSDMEQIAEAVRKIRAHAELLSKG